MYINDLRVEIDKVDSEIVKLFEQRMSISAQISKFKKANGLPLFDEERERALLESRVSMLENDKLESYLKQLFKTLMELSKGYQFQASSEKNIVLIGIMGSGKTSKGKLLASRLGMKYIDVDEEIEAEQNMSIPEIFEAQGKYKFRELESKKIEEISKEKRCVISTGGGVVLSDTNMKNLKSNGIVVFVNRDIEEIVKTIDTSNRPLLKDGAQKLFEIYNDRLQHYKKWADIEIEGDYKTIEEAVDKLINELF